MNLTVIVIFSLFLALYAWLGRFMYQVMLACWSPARSKEPYLALVHAREDRFFKGYKWLSPLLVIQFALGILGVGIHLAKEITLAFAS